MSALAGTLALVTGASRGIGLATARALEQSGARVARLSRTPAPAPDGLTFACDLTDPRAVASLAESLLRDVGVPDLIVNNAGSFLIASIDDTSPEAFAGQLAANLTGPFLVCRAFLPALRQRGAGRLITLGSIADHRGLPGNAAYAAAKYGVRGLHEVLREELKGTGVLSTLISPGPTDTAVWDVVDPDHRPGFTPRAKMLRPEDVADAVCWVAGRPPHVDIDWLRLGPA